MPTRRPSTKRDSVQRDRTTTGSAATSPVDGRLARKVIPARALGWLVPAAVSEGGVVAVLNSGRAQA